jgi:hypothetical protein
MNAGMNCHSASTIDLMNNKCETNIMLDKNTQDVEA